MSCFASSLTYFTRLSFDSPTETPICFPSTLLFTEHTLKIHLYSDD